MYSKVIVLIGCGGIGSHLLPPLARYLASLEEDKKPEKVVLVDGDDYDEGNANRQEFVMRQCGDNKAQAQSERFNALYPDSCIEFEAVTEYIGEENAKEIIPDGATVFLCVDNHVCRHLVSKHCQSLDTVYLVSGGNELTDGNVQCYGKVEGSAYLEPIEKRHPEIATTKDGDRSAMSCEELANLPSGGQIIITNLMAAVLMLQMFWNKLEDRVDTKEVYFDVEAQKTRAVKDETK